MISITQKVLTGALAGSLILSVVLGGALAWSRHELSNAKEVIQSLVEWRDGIVDATRLATGSNEVTVETTQANIQQLGNLRIELINAVENQNKAIDALAKETELALEAAERAKRERHAAIQRAETLRQRLAQRALSPAPPEQMEQAVRATQDDLYEAGL